MPVQKNLNVSPYYDDFNPDKNFYRVLYKAGFPIQARELTTQQTILQNQIEGLAARFLTEGDNVVPGEYQFQTPVAYVRLSSFTQGVSIQDFVGYDLTGANSGVVAHVVFAVEATDDDDATLYVRYTNSGESTESSTFEEGEILESANENAITGTVGVNLVSKPVDSTPTGLGSLFYVSEGSYFIDGMVIRNDYQKIVVGKYTERPTADVGFNVLETVVTSSEDPSLLDNSQGSSNFAAPGADRLKITLELVAREPDTTSPNFVLLSKITQGNISTQPAETVKWDWLYEILARRTYDESGDYIVTDFPLTTMEYHNDADDNQRGLYDPDPETGLYPNVPGSGNTGGLTYTQADAKYVISLAAGKAYVKGFEVEYLNNVYLYGSKPRTESIRDDATTQLTEGYNLTVTDVYGTPDFVNLTGDGNAVAFDDVVMYRNFIDGFTGDADDANGRPLNIGNAPWQTFHIIADGDIGVAPTGFVEVYKEGNTCVVNSSTDISRGDTIGNAVVLVSSKIDPSPAGVMSPRYLKPNDQIPLANGFYGYNSTFDLGVMSATYFTQLSIVGVVGTSTEWTIGNIVTGEDSGTTAVVEEGSTLDTLIVSNVVGEFIAGEEVIQGNKVSRILKPAEVSRFIFTDKGTGDSTVDLSAETSIDVKSLGSTKTLTVADGEIIATATDITITDVGRQALEDFPSSQAVSGNSRVDLQVETSPNGVKGYALSRSPILSNTLGLTKSFYSSLADTNDFSANISIQSASDADVVNLANNASFRGVAGENFVECNDFSANASLQLQSGDVVTFVDDTGLTVNRVVEFATKPVGYGNNVAKSRIYFTTTIPNDVTSNGVQRIRTRTKGSPEEILIYNLPQEVVSTLEANEEASGINYQVFREFIVNVSSGVSTITLTTGKNNETFINNDELTTIVVAENISNPTDPDDLEGRSLIPSSIDITQDSGRKVVYTLQSSLSSSVKVKVIAPVFVTNAISKRKVLTEDEVLEVSAADAAKETISLEHTDIYKLKSVVQDGRDITNNYTLDNGQRDNIYALGRLLLKTGLPPATGALTVTFDYFEHDGDGDFFSVDSYTSGDEFDYANIPTYTPTFNLEVRNVNEKQATRDIIQLRDVIDFRPAVNTAGSNASQIPTIVDGVDAQGARNFRSSSNDGNGFAPNLPIPDTLFVCDMRYYLPRYDSVFLQSNGTISLIPGRPDLQPSPTGDLSTAIRLYDIHLPAYTFDLKDIYIKKFNYKRYQMKDIAVIDRQVQNLTEVVTLSLLEQDALNVAVRDAVTGLDRFKNGIVVDNFSNHQNGATNNDQYRNSIDPKRDILRAPYFIDQINLQEEAQTEADRNDSSYSQSNGIATLDYELTNYLDQPQATRWVNLQPYSVFTYTGDLLLDPPIDTFTDQNRLPDLVIEDNSLYNAMEDLTEAMNDSGFGTVWSDWETTSVSNDGRTETQERTETTTEINVSTGGTVTTSYGDRVTDVQVAETMRSIPVYYVATNLKPNTRYYAFFDGVEVSDWVSIDNMSNDFDDGASRYIGTPNADPKGFGYPIISDDIGSLLGVFLIPNGRAPVAETTFNGNMTDVQYRTEGTTRSFNTGTRILRFTDNKDNPDDLDLVRGICEADFTSSGVIIDVQETVVSTRIPQFSTSTSVTDTESQTITQPLTEDEVLEIFLEEEERQQQEAEDGRDPVAQTFFIETENAAEGVFLKEMDVYFRTADTSEGCEVYITTTDGGVPTETIVPHSHVTKKRDTVIRVVCTNLDGDSTTINKGTTVVGQTSGATGIVKSNITFRSATDNAETNVNNNVYNLLLDNYDGNFVANEEIVPQVSPAISDKFFTAKDEVDVVSAQITKLGSGYTTATATFSSPELPGGRTAAATVKVFDGYVYDIQVTDTGSGYTSSPSITISGDGTGAVASVRVSSGRLSVDMGVATSDDATLKTTFKFHAPVYLQAGVYYAVVLKAATSLDYTVWTAKMGENLVGTNTRVTRQPTIGALFMSQNGALWTEDQTQDLAFHLRRCKFFVNQTGVIKLQNNNWEPRLLDTDPIETNIDGVDTGSTIFGDNPRVIKIYHNKHGMVANDLVAIDGVVNNPGGIPNEDINGIHTVLNADFSTFTIMVDTAATASTKDGGSLVKCTYNRPFEVINIYSGVMNFSTTAFTTLMRSTQAAGITGYNSANAYKTDNAKSIPLEKTYYYTGARQVANYLNEAAFTTQLGGKKSMELTAALSSSNDYMSPVIDVTRTNANIVRNLIDNPSQGDDVFGAATRTVTFSNDVSAASFSVNDPVEFNDGSTDRTVYVKDFNSTTKKLKISGRFADLVKTASTYTNSTLNSGGAVRVSEASNSAFIPETDPNGSVYSKWISRLFQFENPCDGIELKLAAIFYSTADIRVYYRPRTVGFDGELENENWIPFNETGYPNDVDKISARSSEIIDPRLIPPSSWQSLTWSVQDIPKFDAISVKIVMTSNNPALAPLIDDMQMICSE